ncbi:hypothetical protein N658DRAFT_491742 [Parathielavia hyrcaniae]|uniref:Uncharacterized protein n=1 Tax=Parathielavia hyrcaniae TaxID=113614 RepID=A0AAN6T605_9PEZI|nr:hypothetical protein N658DRAFT_491742 [Parathielavia hyrcaniae]
MATNSSRGNSIAAADGPPTQTTSTPPRVSETLKSEIRQETRAKDASQGSTGLHAAGQDAEGGPPGARLETVEELAKESASSGGREG